MISRCITMTMKGWKIRDFVFTVVHVAGAVTKLGHLIPRHSVCLSYGRWRLPIFSGWSTLGVGNKTLERLPTNPCFIPRFWEAPQPLQTLKQTRDPPDSRRLLLNARANAVLHLWFVLEVLVTHRTEKRAAKNSDISNTLPEPGKETRNPIKLLKRKCDTELCLKYMLFFYKDKLTLK